MLLDDISTIGVVDSGIGGISVVKKLLKSNVKNIIYFADNMNMPYGNKSRVMLSVELKKYLMFFFKNTMLKK